MNTLNYFPSESIPNSEKEKPEFGQKYAKAIWGEWEGKYYKRKEDFLEQRQYAVGKQKIDSCKQNIASKYNKLEFLNIDWNDKLNLLPRLLRKVYNAVDMKEFVPNAYAIDPTAKQQKTDRKENKLKLLYAKEFIQQTTELNGGLSPVPLDQIPQSKEQIELEEETAKPLEEETAEELLLQYVMHENMFDEIQKTILKRTIENGLGVTKIETCPIEGLKIREVQPEFWLHSTTNKKYFSDCKYFAEVTDMPIEKVKSIAKKNKVVIDDDEIALLTHHSVLQGEDREKVRALYYHFKTSNNVVTKKKIKRDTGKISLIDRTNDEGTEKEYNPKRDSDISERVVDYYECWYEGIMLLDGNNIVIEHKKSSNIPEYKGTILPPYIAVAPRMTETGYNSLVEEVIPRVNSIQELRYRIVHERNIMKGTITQIDPDNLANITLGNKLLDPSEVLSFYFSLNLNFVKTRDSDGDLIQNQNALREIQAPIPYKLRELSLQFIEDVRLLDQSFGYIGADERLPDDKTLGDFEPYRLSDNNSMKDYTDALHTFSILNFQVISSRINDIFKYSDLKERYVNMIGLDDVEVLERYKEGRKDRYFDVFIEYIPTKQERAELIQNVRQYVLNGILDPLDGEELLSIKNKKLAYRLMRLRMETKKKELEEFEIRKAKESQNGSVLSAQVAIEGKMKLAELEHQLKMVEKQVEFEQKSFLLQKQGEITITSASLSADKKGETEEFRRNFEFELAKFKKEEDGKIRIKAQNNSAENQSKLIEQRKGNISGFYEDSTENQEVDLSQLQN